MALQEEMESQGIWLFRFRGVLPIVVLLIGTLQYLRTKIHPDTFFLSNTPYLVYYEWFCLLVSLFGLAIRVYSVGHTPRNTSGRNVKEQVAEKLNTSGIYSVVRHPLYVGNFFMWLGLALMTGQFWFIIAFCLFYWVYYERIMFAEEQFLRRKFGTEYTDWAMKTSVFIPGFEHFNQPNLPFSWKKVLKNEKNGLAATFLLFTLFDVSGKLITGEQNFNLIWIAMTVLSLLMYVVLKVLKTKTSVLQEADR